MTARTARIGPGWRPRIGRTARRSFKAIGTGTAPAESTAGARRRAPTSLRRELRDQGPELGRLGHADEDLSVDLERRRRVDSGGGRRARLRGDRGSDVGARVARIPRGHVDVRRLGDPADERRIMVATVLAALVP